jgi:hypothetical protein
MDKLSLAIRQSFWCSALREKPQGKNVMFRHQVKILSSAFLGKPVTHFEMQEEHEKIEQN